VYQGNESQLVWVVNRKTDQALPPLECTLEPGEAIYFPTGWWHATLNLDPYNVFASVFTHERAGPAPAKPAKGARAEEVEEVEEDDDL
jgi:hypothetical protein